MKLSQESLNDARPIVRLLVEATCPICGPITNVPAEGIFAIVAAQEHTAQTAHVVILNGTTDQPEIAEDWPTNTVVIPAQWGQA